MVTKGKILFYVLIIASIIPSAYIMNKFNINNQTGVGGPCTEKNTTEMKVHQPLRRQCVVSFLNRDERYIRMAEVLGYSLIKHKINANRIMMITKDSGTTDNIDRLRHSGWITKFVEIIPQPGAQTTIQHFREMFTKLQIWNMTECDVAIYMDADTLTIKNFDELFSILPNDLLFAATPDNLAGKYMFGVNAGVFVCKPNTEQYNLLVKASVEKQDKYNHQFAEQDFFSYYFKLTALRLPFVYNANEAIWKYNTEDWDSFKHQIKIIHYTIQKPSFGQSTTETHRYWNEMESEFLALKNKTNPL